MEITGFGSFTSHVIGWAYFIAWSASFYPQAILNYKRKSVQGLSLDFIFLNVLGFLCYSVFNLAFYFSTSIQDQYRDRNDGQDNLVRSNDVFFAVHALVLSTFTLFQTFFYKVCSRSNCENEQSSSLSLRIISHGHPLSTPFSNFHDWAAD